MVPNLARAKHAVSTDIDPLGGDDGAAVQPGVATDVDHRLRTRGDQSVDLGVRPGIDVRLEHHPARTRDPQAAIPQQPRSDGDPRPNAVGQGCGPAQASRRRLFPIHALSDYPRAYDDRSQSQRFR